MIMITQQKSVLMHVTKIMVVLLVMATGHAVAKTPDSKIGAAGCCKKEIASGKDQVANGRLVIPDITVLNEEGEEVSFYSDLVQGRTVVINGIFTTCTTICPPMGANYAKLQKLLKGLDADVQLISISLDPATDTPQRLKAWAAKFGAQPGWTLVTGQKTGIDELLKSLQLFSADKREHAPLILIGNDARGVWTRTYGLAPAAKMTEVIRDVLDLPSIGSTTASVEVRP